MAIATRGDDVNSPHSTFLIRNLLKNQSFRNQFINTFCDHLNTTFLSERVTKILENYKLLYESEIERHRKYFPSHRIWSNEISAMKTFAELRPQYIYPHLMSKFGLENNKTITIDVDNTDMGNVKINTLICPEYPWNGEYFPNILVKVEAIPKPGFRFVKWSDDNLSQEREVDVNNISNLTAFFETFSYELMSVVISEINYKSSPDFDTDDWIEFLNLSNKSVDMSGSIFKDGDDSHSYIFPENTFIEPNGILVLCKDKDKFQTLHSENLNVVGNINFGFSSNGETFIHS